MKKSIITLMAITCIIGFTAASSSAGSSKRDRLEGFIIGSHAGFIGATILSTFHNNRPKVYVNEPRHQKRHYRNSRWKHQERRGHWEMERIWVEPEYEEKWNPGHYNRKGEWRSGRYQRFVVREGYWVEKKVWVCRY